MPLQGGPQAILVDQLPLAELDPAGTGFHLVPPLGRLVELTGRRHAGRRAVLRDARHARRARGDTPGLVLGRIVAQLVNEAHFALGEGIGSAEDIDAGMELGLNHPRGPLEWGEVWGLDAVLAVLDGLHAEYREERWRPAPAPRAMRAGRIGGGGNAAPGITRRI